MMTAGTFGMPRRRSPPISGREGEAEQPRQHQRHEDFVAEVERRDHNDQHRQGLDAGAARCGLEHWRRQCRVPVCVSPQLDRRGSLLRYRKVHLDLAINPHAGAFLM